jgi:coenzyme F420-reducing hydrogenase delta subunit
MPTHPLDQVKNLVKKIQILEDKLMNTSFMSMQEQQKLHEEIKRYRAEIDLMERRTRPRS